MSLTEVLPPQEPVQNTRASLIVRHPIPVFDTAMFEQMMRLAKAMARAPLVPQHLKGGSLEEGIANCFLVVNQALKWKMDPFAVAQATFVLHGKIGYEGKLVTAALNSCLGVRLYYYFTGERGTPSFGIIVRDKPRGEETDREVTGTVDAWQTKEKSGAVNQAWLRQPEDMLIYRGSRQWARRYAPEVILGVLTDDELEDIAAREGRHEVMQRPMVVAPSVPMVPQAVPPPPTSVPAPAEAVAPEAAPPAPAAEPPKQVEDAEVVEDEMLPDPDRYLEDLEVRLSEAESADELHETWSGHLAIAHRIPDEHQKRARKMHFEHQKRFIPQVGSAA